MGFARTFLFVVLTMVAVGCGGETASGSRASGTASDSTVTSGPEVWSLSPDPLAEIGVVSGEDAYQLHDVRDALRLPDGRLVLANSGSHELRFFDADGRFLFASGSPGDGPGEWRLLDELRLLGTDTILVRDPRLGRLGLVDARDGEYLGALPEERTDQHLWPVWFRAGLLIEAPLAPEERGVLLPVLSKLDVLAPGAPAFVKADREGRVWVRSAPSAEAAAVRVFDLDGRLRSVLRLPPGFRLLDLSDRWVLGVRRDELDVEFVQLHALSGRGAWSGPSLSEVLARGDVPTLPDRTSTGDMSEEVVGTLKVMATTQEVHYAEHLRYSADLEALGTERYPLDIPDGIVVDVLDAGTAGWTARMMERAGSGGCVISYGAFRLAENLPPGRVTCWRGAPG